MSDGIIRAKPFVSTGKLTGWSQPSKEVKSSQKGDIDGMLIGTKQIRQQPED
jgi:hypothetical protein